MTDDTWDEAYISSAFVSWHTAPSEDGSYIPMTEDEASTVFDKWLNEVQAKAFDEGFDQGHYVNDSEDRDCGCRENPYREGA